MMGPAFGIHIDMVGLFMSFLLPSGVKAAGSVDVCFKIVVYVSSLGVNALGITVTTVSDRCGVHQWIE